MYYSYNHGTAKKKEEIFLNLANHSTASSPPRHKLDKSQLINQFYRKSYTICEYKADDYPEMCSSNTYQQLIDHLDFT
ncbi:unnamed protein product [Gordionus sp. m RMFG-2023]